MEPNSLFLTGPTACGKTAIAVRLARKLNAEIISGDSRQVYKGLDIGSGKDLSEYSIGDGEDGGGETVRHHLIDIAEFSDSAPEYTVFDFQRDCYKAFSDIRSRGKLPIVTGGSGMYIESVLRGFTFDKKEKLHSDEPNVRPEINPLVLYVFFPREIIRKRIKKRLAERFDSGMILEVKSLHERGISWQRLERLGLEYRFIALFLQGRIASFDELFELLYTAICQFAKRQETWFKGMARRGTAITQINLSDADAVENAIGHFSPRL